MSAEREADEGVEVVEVDARGLRCPIPVIRLGTAIRDRPAGSLVRLLATDPAARSDVAAFCRMRGHELVETRRRAGLHRIPRPQLAPHVRTFGAGSPECPPKGPHVRRSQRKGFGQRGGQGIGQQP